VVESSSNKPQAARARPVAVGLTRAAVVEAALADIDENGLREFSLRRLARRLGVNVNVVAWHVGNRDTLLAEVGALVLRDVTHPREGQDWRDWLRALFHRFRAALHRHPHAAPLIGADIVSNLRPDLAMVEALLAALEDAGVPQERLIETFNAVQAALVGFVTQELARMPEDRSAWQENMRAGLAAPNPVAYPRLVRELPRMLNRAFILRWQNGVEMPMDRSFEVYVDCVIAGIQGRDR
jgi:TetR/AcrR family tetracycline transcriptional repressor